MFYPQQHIFLLLEDFLSLVEPYIHMEPIRVVVVIKIMIFFIEITHDENIRENDFTKNHMHFENTVYIMIMIVL